MSGPRPDAGPRPLIGVLCCNERLDRPVQTVATRFLAPLTCFAGADALLVPSVSGLGDLASIAGRLDGLFLTGSRSNVAPARYGKAEACTGEPDTCRDETALALAGAMVARGKPVFGVCRGLQEINVLFGGTLRTDLADAHKHPEAEAVEYHELFGHRHAVDLLPGGLLNPNEVLRSIEVNSVHEQGIDALGRGLRAEAVAHDGVIEAVSGEVNGALVLAVQWHPECDAERCAISRSFFVQLGQAARGAPARPETLSRPAPLRSRA